MTSVVFYFQVHQPFRLCKHGPDDGAGRPTWFDDALSREVLERVAERCYLPMNALLQRRIKESDGRFRCAFSLSGTALEQIEAWAPAALDGFVSLARTGAVEFMAETSHHSLAFTEAPREFEAQVAVQARRVEEIFGRWPTAFRNTELIVDEELVRRMEGHGFEALLCEGAPAILGDRSPCHPYRARGTRRIQLLPRHFGFSDDIAFRFSDRSWWAYPLRAETLASWMDGVPAEAETVGIYVDYETFGEHQAADTGIFGFMEELPRRIEERSRFDFATPTEAARRYAAAGEVEIPLPVSWADQARDLSAWLGNPMQREAHQALYALREKALAAGPEIAEHWRRLSTSDHVYYMSTKRDADYDVHAYFSHYDSPHQAFVCFMRALEELSDRISDAAQARSGGALA